MIVPERLYDLLKQRGVNFYTGVPDSLLKHFLKYLEDHAGKEAHVITANEGLAIALASGHYFATGHLPLVYLQNSGLGNIVNPLTSLTNKEMYSIPLLVMIGWRGRPGTNDEPQHIKMGRITIPLLEVLELPYYTLDENENSSFEKITMAAATAKNEKKAVVLLMPEEIFEKYEGIEKKDSYPLQREEVIREIIAHLKGDETVICTTGKTGREFYEQNLAAGKKIGKYLLSVGAMGHANHLALGIRMNSREKVLVLDGDGALLMQMGSLPTIAHHVKEDFIHIVINNGSHESVGGQPTEGFFADLCAIARASGYLRTICITNARELAEWLEDDAVSMETQFVEIRTNRKSRMDLARPVGSPADWKNNFVNALNKPK